ncbi:hypothetical protein AGMMS49960_10110 [Betaproteobacteria bacterium]|nr:hypothetical protein AGMMS49543_23610 [Betaproteobacteria bacterium]GHU00922.1 hypothetical protein AGMMS49960_10110 [Betaproteobacteria bacterium]GHU19860.1 hypothetical protein AGMMS50243_12910 [Betaproteobacteria bacterium]
MSPVVSSIPGRLRVRAPNLRTPETLARLAATLLALDASCHIETNPRCGSLLLRYDATRLDPQDAKSAVEAATLALLEPPIRPPKLRHHYTRTSLKLNRYAKYGMLASLGASLIYAATGATRAHALTGAVFVALMGTHMLVHRHRLTA